MTSLLRRTLAGCIALLIVACAPQQQTSWLGEPERLAEGIEFYRNNDATLVEELGPIAVYLLRVDPAAARLESALAHERVLDAETVLDTARRHQAVAAINGGFFNRANGEPTGLLKVNGELVSDSNILRGAVVVSSAPEGRSRLAFDRLAAKMSMAFDDGTQEHVVAIDGVGTTRERGKLMLYSPGYYAHTDTAPTGTEWVLDGDPLRVTEVRVGFGSTRIPRGGVVLSYGGVRLPPSLVALTVGVEVRLSTSWRSAFGTPDDVLDAAAHIVNGAGLLRRNRSVLDDWREEVLSVPSFIDARHPRTLIGLDQQGAFWLAAIDGRQPDYSIGMTFADLQRLSDRLDLTDALNLDGGGSTTMVVRGQVVNRPSDLTGVRPVGDAILVMPR